MSTIATPSQTCGPLFGFALFPRGIHEAVAPEDPEAVVIEGWVRDGDGQHIGYDGFVEVWSEGQACRARTVAGRYRVVVRKPRAEPLPDGRAQAPHVHIVLFARGLTRHLVSRIYFPGEAPANLNDPVLQALPPPRRDTLIAHAQGDARHLSFDIVLQGDGETVFFRTP